MKCGETADLLMKLLSAGGGESIEVSSTEEDLLEQMIAVGYVARIKVPVAEKDELEDLKLSLHQYQNKERDTLDKLHAYRRPDKERRSLMRLLDSIDREEAELRSRILKLSESASIYQGSVTVDGERCVVTYKGRELVENLNPRLPRVAEWGLEEFHKELQELQAAFDARAVKAAAVLREISPRLPKVDEIHLRAAAVGLSVRSESPTELTAAYVAAVRALGAEMRQFTTGSISEDKRTGVAEQLCLNERTLNVDTVSASAHTFATVWWTISSRTTLTEDEAIRCAIMLYSKPPSEMHDLLEKARGFSANPLQPLTPFSSTLAAAILLTAQGDMATGTFERFVAYQRMLRQRVPIEEADFSAAILAVAGGQDVQAGQRRFEIAKDYLSRFTENGMVSPAAMVAVMSPDVEEALDILRFASAKITQYRLSLGGMENLSLGVKMLLGTALVPVIGRAEPAPTAIPPLPGGKLLAVAGLTGVALASPVLIPALLSFHDRELHRLAVSDFRFHPVHTHYVYG